ncbi:MAG: hypothetical protein Q9197_000900 [Variospora fuerteventurae]
MSTLFTCSHRSSTLPYGQSRQHPPANLPHGCHACMRYSSRNQEAAFRRNYDPEIDSLNMKIRMHNLRFAQGTATAETGVRLGQDMKRYMELNDELMEMIMEAKAPYERSLRSVLTNVLGTQNLLKAAISTKSVHALIYTSSSSIHIRSRKSLITEDAPLVDRSTSSDEYAITKAIADTTILEANSSKLRTICLRLPAVYGERDNQLIPGSLAVLRDGNTHVQLGNNKNLYDAVYVDNAACAHVLAAKALLKDEPLAGVSGEAFFITDDAPIPFWDFQREIYAAAGSPTDLTQVRVIPAWVGMGMAALVEYVYWMFTFGQKLPPNGFRRDVLRWAVEDKSHCIDKAKARLGYRPLVDKDEGIRRGQSSPGPHFDILDSKLSKQFQESLEYDTMAGNHRFCVPFSAPSASANTIYVSLTSMCAEIAINAGQNAYFARQLLEIDPNLAQTFRQFGSSSWQLLYLYPPWLSPDMYSTKDCLVEALTLYYDVPAEKKTDAAWITKYLEQEMRYLGFDNREMAILMMFQYCGMNTNVHKACFWMLSYMLHEPGLPDTIREETASAFVDQPSGSAQTRNLMSPARGTLA